MNIFADVKHRDKVLLYFPRLVDPKVASARKPAEPISVMTLADHLESQGFKAAIYDNRVDDDIEGTLDAVGDELLCVGISAMGGYQVVDGYEFSKLVKKKFPHVPVVWGGAAPSSLPQQFLDNPYIDVVVKGQGEQLFPELAATFRDGASIQGLMGISYKDNGKIIHEPMRPLAPIENNLPIDYSRIDASRYSIGDGWIQYGTSFGCPYSCAFCGLATYFERTWFCLSADRVVRELKAVDEVYGLKRVAFWDATFFVDIERVKQILKGFIREGMEFSWTARAQVKQVVKFDDEVIELLAATRCRYTMVGVESGSQRLRKLFRKDFDYDRLITALDKMARVDIPVRAMYIFAPPEENREDFLKTIRSMTQVQKLNPRNLVSMFQYTPIPGTELGDKEPEKIGPVPGHIDDWDSYYKKQIVRSMQPWLQPKDHLGRQPIAFYWHAALCMKLRPALNRWFFRLPLGAIKTVAALRLKLEVFVFPLEWYIYRIFRGFYVKLSRLAGKKPRTPKQKAEMQPGDFP